MATANPDVAEITCKNPECPRGVFQWNTILNHILRSKNCKIFYHDAEIDSMREHSKELQKQNKAKRKRDNYNPGESTQGNGVLKEPKLEKIKSQCKVCKKSFVVLLAHLSKSTDCKTKYGTEYDCLKSNKDKEKEEYQKVYKNIKLQIYKPYL